MSGAPHIISIWRYRGYSSISRAAASVKASTENLTGHSDVLQAQKLVGVRKEELRRCTKELEEATARYEEVQDKLKNLYARKTQVYQYQRRDLSALQSINTEEESLLYDEHNLHTQVEELRQKGKDSFEKLNDAILESHERERAQSEKMKYYSRLGSIIGAVFGFFGSNLFLRREVRVHNQRQEERIEDLRITVSSLALQGGMTEHENSGSYHQVSANSLQLGSAKELEAKLDRLSSDVQRHSRVLEKVDSHLQVAADRAGAIKSDDRRQFSDSDVLVIGLASFSILAALLAAYR